jgi:pyruvate dehydrogenase E1 component alpha subunit
MALKIPKKVINDFDCYTPLKAPKNLSKEQQLRMYYEINLIREFDTHVRDLWMDNQIYGLAHAYVGSEAIAVGACTALQPNDCITSTHRGHGHAIAKGADIKRMMAELFGKYEGYNHGKGGSMHIADVENGMLGATGIVGSGMPIALGAAMAADLLENKTVAICFHGDGGTNQGVWHESVNMAAAWKLPVVFLTENNQRAIATTIHSVAGEPCIHRRAAAYGIPGFLVDGYNPFAVYQAVKAAAARARKGEGPSLIEAKTVRLVGHFVADDQAYRDLDELEPFWQLEPVRRMRAFLLDNKVANSKKLKSIEERAKQDVQDAIHYASTECTEPPPESLYDHIYAAGEKIE